MIDLNIRQRLKEISEEKREIRKKVDASNNADEIRVLGAKMEGLHNEEDELRDQLDQGVENRGSTFNPLNTYGVQMRNIGSFEYGQAAQQRTTEDKQKWEQRAAALKSGETVIFDAAETRAITVATGNIVTPTHTSGQLNPTFNEVSSIVDLVKSIPLMGGKAYRSGFMVHSGDADYTAEGADYHESDPVMDYVDINQAKVSTYFDLSEEVVKLGGDYYISQAYELARTAIRKKMAEQIIKGTGGQYALVGILNAPDNVIPDSTDLSVSTMDGFSDPSTPFSYGMLDDVVFNYGGDEAVEGGAYLILNKQTLAVFASARDPEGRKMFNVKLDASGTGGTINSNQSYEVPFVISSTLKSWKTAASGEVFALYGKLKSYEMPIFSQLEVVESRDFKFKSGMISYKAAVWAGGNVASYKGFMRIKKA